MKRTIYIERQPGLDIRAVEYGADRERGFFLLGYFDADRNMTVVNRVLPAEDGDAESISLTPGLYLHHELFADAPWERDSVFVGDLHSHPVDRWSYRAGPSGADRNHWSAYAKTPGSQGWAGLLVTAGRVEQYSARHSMLDWTTVHFDGWFTTPAGVCARADVQFESEGAEFARLFSVHQAELRHKDRPRLLAQPEAR